MILFLYGENSYSSRQKLNGIKQKYIDVSLGDTNLSVIDLAEKDWNFARIEQTIQAMPFLAKSRLVIIKKLLSNGGKKIQEKVLEYLPKVPSSTNLIFYEDEKFDKRNALYKKLSKKGGTIKSQEFKPMSDYELRNWVKSEVEKREGKIENQAIDKLILYVGNDLWRMGNEIEKLTLFCHSGRVSIERVEESIKRDSSTSLRSAQNDIIAKNVELLVRPKITANVFDLVDALGNKNLKRAQEEKRKLLSSGEHELYVLTMIVYQFRNLLIIKDLVDKKMSSFEIKTETKMHQFVISKTTNQSRNFTMPELKKIYQKLLDYDTKIKSGQIDAGLALDLLIVELCG